MQLGFHSDIAVQNAAKGPTLRKLIEGREKIMSKKPLIDVTQMRLISIFAFSDWICAVG